MHSGNINMNRRFKQAGIILAMLPILFVISCKTQKGKFEFVNPANESRILKGEKVALKLNFPQAEIDSVVYSVDGDIFERKTDTSSVVFNTDDFSYGNKRLSAKLYAQGKEDIAYSEITLVPPAPKPYAFEVVNTFPHDESAFTQGLYYDNGTLYESTGREGESTLRKVDLATGKVLQKIDLAANEFGEGMTIVGDKAYMLTWLNKKGYIYNKNTFQQVGAFDYQSSDKGWGLTYDGKRFIKSDGTNKLYFLDPVTLKETGSIAVFDDNGEVPNLNELEYVDGKVYANLYYGDRDEIAVINPETGLVEGKVNFVGLYDGKRAAVDNEFNGIAYKPDTKTFLVTGKLWNKLYEVRIKER